MMAQRGVEIYLYATLRPLYPRNDPYPPYRRLGGPQGRSGRLRKISPPTEIRSPDRPALRYLSTCIYLHVLSIRSCTRVGGTKYGQDKC